MAKVKLKRAFLIGGKFYTSGVQEIADEKLKHPHFVRYIKLGLVVAPENEELEKIESGDERMKRIAAKEKDLAAKQKELLKKATAPDKKKKDEERSAVDEEKKPNKG